MRTRQLGHSGIEVGEIALGTMMFGAWGNSNHSECGRMVGLALDAGITLFDTADIYDRGQSELIVGSALAHVARDRYVIATKVGNPMSDLDTGMRGLSRRWIESACDDSLRRLRVDHIDLYQAHRPDPDTPIEETVEAFDSLVRAGKVGAVGTSCFSAAQLDEWYRVAAGASWVVPATEQPPYSILVRGIETDVLPAVQRHGMGLVVWAPLNGGWLTGKYQTGTGDDHSRAQREPDHFDHRDDQMREHKRSLVARLEPVAHDAGLTLIQLALGFVLARPEVSAALIGPRTLPQLESLVHAGAPELSVETLAAIDAIVEPGLTVNPTDNG